MADFTPYFSEIRYLGGASTDFIEVALDNGVDPATIEVVVYRGTGTVRSTHQLDPLPDSSTTGTDVYTVETGVHKLGAIALVSNGVVVAFVSFDQEVTATEGPAAGSTSTQIGTTGAGESLESTDMGSTYAVQPAPNPGTVPCFLQGTLIDTPSGPTAIENLRQGDLVETVDHGVQRVLWTGRRALQPGEVSAHGLQPIRIPAGALGPGVPHQDILVSPAHRVLIGGAGFEMLFGAHEVLAAARHLVGVNGIHVARESGPTIYHHLLFESHELLRSSGLISESFHPAAQGLAGLERAAREELFTLWPELRQHALAYGPTARLCLRRFETRLATSTLRRAA